MLFFATQRSITGVLMGVPMSVIGFDAGMILNEFIASHIMDGCVMVKWGKG